MKINFRSEKKFKLESKANFQFSITVQFLSVCFCDLSFESVMTTAKKGVF